jgi:hypothetical protein
VRVVSPAATRIGGRSVVVRAAATDDTGVALVRLWVDGVPRRSASGPRLAWRWRLHGVRRGSHLILVRAYDARGNAARAAVRVRVGA